MIQFEQRRRSVDESKYDVQEQRSNWILLDGQAEILLDCTWWPNSRLLVIWEANSVRRKCLKIFRNDKSLQCFPLSGLTTQLKCLTSEKNF